MPPVFITATQLENPNPMTAKKLITPCNKKLRRNIKHQKSIKQYPDFKPKQLRVILRKMSLDQCIRKQRIL